MLTCFQHSLLRLPLNLKAKRVVLSLAPLTVAVHHHHQEVKARMRILYLRLFGCILIMQGVSASAHEVSASNVKVYQDGHSIEVWQTTPYKVAHGIAGALSDEAPESERDAAALKAIALGWQVISSTGECVLSRQASRRIHHDTQLQMRYLYHCQKDAEPKHISMPWLKETPKSHFVFLDIDTPKGRRNRVIERDNTTVPLLSIANMKVKASTAVNSDGSTQER